MPSASVSDKVDSPEQPKNLLSERSIDLRDHFPFAEVRANQKPALDKLSRWNQSPQKFFLLEGPTGFGKCFAPDTPVLMYDGSIKLVKDIRVGDLLMGDDSTPRRVLSLSHGWDEMFDVVPTKGASYRVNSRHILSLRFTKGIGTKGTYTNNQKSQVPAYRKLGIRVSSAAVIDIPLVDYRGLSKTQKHILKGYRVGVEFPEKGIPIDPYFMGLWLGDGDKDRPAITTSDPEIGGFLYSYALKLGLSINVQFHNNARTFDLNTGERGGYAPTRTKNLLLESLRSLGVLFNKHIPLVYKANNRENRLKLLAGLIDSDGSRIKGGYDFVFELERLATDVAYLCRSLGFAAYVEPCERECTNSVNGRVRGQYWRVLMSGRGVENIPSVLVRKQGEKRRQKKDVLVTGIDVVPVGRGEFFGFSVNGNERFLLADFTVVHNSPVDIACASHAKTMPGFGIFEPGAHILTPQKTLAEQYMKDFAPMGLVELKGRANYRCARWSEREGYEVDCETGALLNESTGEGNCGGSCPYAVAKDRYIRNPFGTTNFAYYLNETNHAGQIPNRSLLILDEGHNTEDQILSLTDTEINQRRCDKYGVGKLPLFAAGDNRAVLKWLDEVFVKAAFQYSAGLAKKFRDADDDRVQVAKEIKAVDNFLQRINMFRHSENPEEWFVWSDWNEKTKKGTGDLFIKPLTARLFADDLLFSKARKVLITSATILDFRTFMRNLGIDASDAQILAVDSEFPVDHRPMFYRPVGSMSYNDGKKRDHIDVTLPKMATEIEDLLTRYMAKKGIVHTNSYKVNQYLTRYLQSTSHAHRIITHDNSRGAREEAQYRHLTSKEPTVLFSPSMTEGLDLKEDLSRFQIICKVPYPALDPYTRARKDRDAGWYQWQTALKLVQATGRSVRSKTDKAHTYILDSDFATFIRNNNRVLPQYWLNAIIWG